MFIERRSLLHHRKVRQTGKTYHRIIVITPHLGHARGNDDDSILYCRIKKEAFDRYDGFRFCPSCGKNVSRICRRKK